MAELEKSWNVTSRLLAGDISFQDVRADLKAKGQALLAEKARTLLGQMGTTDRQIHADAVKQAFRVLATMGGEAHKGDLLPFEDFRHAVEAEVAGVVFTAHPTFSLSPEAAGKLSGMIAAGSRETSSAEGDMSASLEGGLRPKRAPTLTEEAGQAVQAALNARKALLVILECLFEVAQELYPQSWSTLTPKLMTIATWAGFDLDGRTDIGWWKSQQLRYQLADKGLDAFEGQLASLEESLKAAGVAANESVHAIKRGIATFRAAFEEGARLLEEVGQQASQTARAFETLNRAAMMRLADKEKAVAAIDKALDTLVAESGEAAKGQSSEHEHPSARQPVRQAAIKAAVLRAQWQNFGLGLCHIHFRVNAAQLHNAVRSKLGLTSEPDKSAGRRHYLAAITRLLDEVKPVNIHYGSLAEEQTTAKRVFMLAAQFEKHFDGRTPIRMLVAESDTAFTLLTALYYARLFGVDGHVEISPLFETEAGLQRGDRVISELVSNAHFRRYVEAQGRFAVQLGFSDSGRYMGQPAANLAIERFKLRLVKVWKAEGLGHVQLVFFDTHGESIGRGAHPGDLRDRFLYTHTPAVRRALCALPAPYKQEVSFQGGDGFLWFASPDTALAVLGQLICTRLSRRPNAPDDIFYDESGWALDFFLTLKEKQERMVSHSGYLSLLDSAARNFLYPTGSRAAKRQQRGRTQRAGGLEHVGQLRAIPNNAILHQLGFLANTVVGLGSAIDLAPETFKRMMAGSSRFRRLMHLVQKGLHLSDLQLTWRYILVMSPDSWLDLADNLPVPEPQGDTEACDTEENLMAGRGGTRMVRRAQMRRLSRLLEGSFNQDAMSRLIRHWRRGAGKREDRLEEIGIALAPDDVRADLAKLHELRVAFIMYIYMKTMEIPAFSSRTDVSLNDIIFDLLHLDVLDAVSQLKEIFPVRASEANDAAFGEMSDYKAEKGYRDMHETLFVPLEEAYEAILEISALIALSLKAYG